MADVAPRRPSRYLTDEERQEALERLLAGESLREVAEAIGVSHETVRSIRRGYQRAARAEAERDPDGAAMRLRYEAGLEAAERAANAEERAGLLAAVVWPGPELLELSRARALAGAAGPVTRATCVGCGGDLASYSEE